MKRRRPGPSRHSKTAFFRDVRDQKAAARAASQTGPSNRGEASGHLLERGPRGGRGDRSGDRAGLDAAGALGGRGVAAAHAHVGREDGDGSEDEHAHGHPDVAAPHRVGAAHRWMPAKPTRISIIWRCLPSLWRATSSLMTTTLLLAGGAVAGLVPSRPCAGSTLSTTAITAALDCPRPDRARRVGPAAGRSNLRDTAEAASGSSSARQSLRRGEPEPAVIASE